MKKKRVSVIILIFGLLLAFGQSRGEAVKLKVTAELANVRVKADLGSAIILQIPQGEILESLGKEGEWYLIKLEQDESGYASGYVHESLVTLVERAPRKEKKAEEKTEKKEPQKTQEKVIPKPPSPFPAPKIPSENAFSLMIGGGGNYVAAKDLNNGARGLAQYYSDYLAVQGKGEVVPLHLGYIMGAEVIYRLTSQISLALGVDYLLGKKESSVAYEKGSSPFTFTTRPEFQALPVRLTISYYPFRYLYFKNGVEYYFAQCRYFYRFKQENVLQEWQGRASAKGLGIQGGVGLELSLFSGLTFFVETSGRYARIKGFKGKDTYKDSGQVTQTEGKLYFYQGKTSTQNSYPLLFIREKKPTEAWVLNPREAELDLSGLTVKAGIKIGF